MADKNTINKIVKWAQDSLKELPSISKKIKDNRKKTQKEEFEEMDKEFGKIQTEMYEKAYDDAIDAFYNSYEPIYYKRRFSLYRAWHAINDPDGSIVGTVPTDDGWSIDEDLLISANIIGARTGAGMRSGLGVEELFKQAFEEGWHGGAKTIDDDKVAVWGKHPKPGVPYYRKPGMVTYDNGVSKMHKYGKWGRRARKMRTPPRKMLLKDIKALNNGELAKIDKELYEKHKQSYQEKVKKYEAELIAPLLQPDWLDDFK